MAKLELRTLDDIPARPAPRCPECGEAMPYYGGTAGFIHCGYKILFRAGGWFDSRKLHVQDERLGTRRDLSHIRQR